MGGWLMMLAAKARKKRICGLIGLSTAVDFGNSLYSSLSKKSKREIKIYGLTKHFWSYGSSYILTKEFFIDANKNKILNRPFKFYKPLILIHGLKDNVVNITVPQKIMKNTSGKNVQIIYLKSSDHRLSSLEDLKLINSAINNIQNII